MMARRLPEEPPEVFFEIERPLRQGIQTRTTTDLPFCGNFAGWKIVMVDHRIRINGKGAYDTFTEPVTRTLYVFWLARLELAIESAFEAGLEAARRELRKGGGGKEGTS